MLTVARMGIVAALAGCVGLALAALPDGGPFGAPATGRVSELAFVTLEGVTLVALAGSALVARRDTAARRWLAVACVVTAVAFGLTVLDTVPLRGALDAGPLVVRAEPDPTGEPSSSATWSVVRALLLVVALAAASLSLASDARRRGRHRGGTWRIHSARRPHRRGTTWKGVPRRREAPSRSTEEGRSP